jgi:hypothetical protein
VRCRVLEVCPERENQLVGSLVLEPGKKEKKQAEKGEKTSLIGSEVTVTGSATCLQSTGSGTGSSVLSSNLDRFLWTGFFQICFSDRTA